MRFGLTLELSGSVASEAARIEQLGFDYLASGEHLFFHGPTPNAFITLAAAAGATSRIRLLSSISLLPLYPAALAAKLVASLDQVSGGRFEYGVGAGGEYPPEYEAVGIRLEDRFRRLDEGLETVRRLLAGSTTDFAGEFITLSGVRLEPTSVQRPAVPIWVAGRKAGAVKRAARHADVWLPYMMSPDQFARSLEDVRAAASRFDRDGAAIRGGLLLWTCVDEDIAWARRQGIAGVSETYQQDFTRLADRYLLLGSPDDVVRRLGEYEQAGASRVIFRVAVGGAEGARVVDTIADEVLPRWRMLHTED